MLEALSKIFLKRARQHGTLPQMMPIFSSTMFQIERSVNAQVIFIIEHAHANRPRDKRTDNASLDASGSC